LYRMYCGACGEELFPNSKFCSNCGSVVNKIANPITSVGLEYRETSSYQRPADSFRSDIRGTSGYQVSSTQTKMSIDQNKERTGWLNFVIAMNYIALIGLSITALVSFFISFPLFLLFILLAGFTSWMISGLKHFHNSRRILYIVLSLISIIIDLINFEPLGVILPCLQVYALLLHTPTARLFQS
ncbi:MAG: zinc ribbon domain-containing protein, partial [Candidatus Heimdallarchaeota archaeon]|nr:zinc ribbon domain-containing protein [Candidatus Heimdallarchaeota archaeon]